MPINLFPNVSAPLPNYGQGDVSASPFVSRDYWPITPNYNVTTPTGTVAADANVMAVMNAINTGTIIPLGDFGGPNLYYFQTFEQVLGNLVYTIFDRNTTLGLASFSVRSSSYALIRQVLFEPWPKSQIPLQFLVLPPLPTLGTASNGTVTP